jgi:hypothetical protein
MAVSSRQIQAVTQIGISHDAGKASKAILWNSTPIRGRPSPPAAPASPFEERSAAPRPDLRRLETCFCCTRRCQCSAAVSKLGNGLCADAATQFDGISTYESMMMDLMCCDSRRRLHDAAGREALPAWIKEDSNLCCLLSRHLPQRVHARKRLSALSCGIVQRQRCHSVLALCGRHVLEWEFWKLLAVPAGYGPFSSWRRRCRVL